MARRGFKLIRSSAAFCDSISGANPRNLREGDLANDLGSLLPPEILFVFVLPFLDIFLRRVFFILFVENNSGRSTLRKNGGVGKFYENLLHQHFGELHTPGVEKHPGNLQNHTPNQLS